MSSVSIISGVAARVKSLINEPTSSQPKLLLETERITKPLNAADQEKSLIYEATDSQPNILLEMESIIKSLKAADQETKRSKQFVTLEKLIVQLSYDITDAVELSILPNSTPKQRLANLFRRNPRPSSSSNRSPDLKSLAINLKNLKNLVEYVVKEQKGVVPRGKGSISPVKANGNGNRPRVRPVEREVMEPLRRAESVVCVYGDRGMGKTTLAKKVFDDARSAGSEDSFKGFAWVRVKRECEPRNVFEDILQQLNPAMNQADVRGLDGIAIIQQIIAIQTEKKCLLVLEDISDPQDWENVRVALLAGRSSRTLITTPSLELAKMPKSKAQLYIMPPLNGPEISTLLKEKASFDNRELEAYEEIILNLSGGLPLLAVVLGKSFKAADEFARDQLVEEHEKNINRVYRGESEALEACYRILPDELKPCLSYMGLFPEGQAMEVDKLHLMWEAEGIMPAEFSETKNKIFLQSVRNIIEKLASRELVKVEEASMTRMYKSCQLHHLIRKFCIFKGMEEELFEIVDFERGERAKKIAASTRRLAVYLSNYKDGDSITFTAEKIRSLLLFDTLGSPRKSTWPSEISDLKEMSKLRVVVFNGVDFRVANKVLKGIDKLVFLRYLSLRGCWLEAFPSSTSKLLFLETLDLRVHDNCTMIIPNILSHMARLRNLYFPLRYKTERKTKLHVFRLQRLEILVNFHTGVCDVDDLLWLKNLQILATICEENHRDLAAIVEYSSKPKTTLQQSSFFIRNFNHSEERVALLKRVLECQTLHCLHIQGHIEKLPEDVAISPNLTEVVFDGSEFENDPTTVLRRLKNLRSLVLANDAFVGKNMSIAFARKYFPNLRSLKLSNLHHLEKLAFHKGSMLKLSTLVVENCENLKQFLMPTALASRLQAAQRKKGDDVYTLDRTPTIF